MNRLDWATLGCRLLAVYVVILVLMRAATIPATVAWFESQPELATDKWDVAGAVGYTVVRLVAAVLLWIFARRLAALVFGTRGTAADVELDAPGVAEVGMFLIGVSMLLGHVASLFAMVGFATPPGPGVTYLRDSHTVVITELLYLAIGLFLMFGGRFVTQLLQLGATPPVAVGEDSK